MKQLVLRRRHKKRKKRKGKNVKSGTWGKGGEEKGKVGLRQIVRVWLNKEADEIKKTA